MLNNVTYLLALKQSIMKARKSNFNGLIQRHVEMVAERNNLDTDLQMLVFKNYNKFISTIDTIRRYNFIMTFLFC